MATVIRMKRGGRTHAPYYRVVVVDSRAKATGRVIEELGIYHPCARPEPLVEVDEDKALKWLALGACPSTTVRNILSKKGIIAKFAGGRSASAAGAEVPAQEVPAQEEVPTPEAAVEEAPTGE